ncbi:hypothetical protein PZ897_06455 [Hoeflea sp. YIM 152468]|uniref:DUF6656 family protein n=1 Tax=Hoeflea sp. YIM 152468 TaxID=3031759 RepID=UPI0023DA0DA8|nr:DUF6656 family protein [Hoeflea sp. YIM 152468]MDF1607813.1 hypothetical protein [Hoeflea sp. YIM 152468]
MSMFKYYAAKATAQDHAPARAVHTNFLRTGRIARAEEGGRDERRFLSHEEVAKRTGLRLENAGAKTHQRLNRFHSDIRFPRLIFHKTLAQAPHLGYVHVTASSTDFAEHKDIGWKFYIANFSADITTDAAAEGQFFHHIHPGYARMYFAVAMKNQDIGGTRQQVINRDFRDNGLLFRTADPKTALKNVLMLGAKTAELRKIVEAIG